MKIVERKFLGVGLIGSQALAERLVSENKMKAPLSFLLASGNQEQKNSLFPKGSHLGMGVAFPSLHPASVPVSPLQSIWHWQGERDKKEKQDLRNRHCGRKYMATDA